jgi:predicted transcriptional regulator
MTTEKVIRHGMLDAGIASMRELSERTGIPTSTLFKRMKDPGGMTLRELGQIRRAININDTLLFEAVEGGMR